MQAVLESFIAGFPVLILHFSVTLAMLAAGMLAYSLVTPWHEWRLIREGNEAAALSFGGATLGIALPLAFSMSVSFNVWDIIIWGLLAIIIQIAVFLVIDHALSGIGRRIEQNEMSAAIFLVATKLSVAAINSAAISG